MDGLPKNPKIPAPWEVRNKTEVRAILREFQTRGMESLRLYRPLPFQDAFHQCRKMECLLMKGTRVGGSLAGFVEDARAALCCDPYDKYPKKGDYNIVCLGYGEPHVGRVIHRLLFRPGAFTIIKDEKTKDWRTFRPWPREEERGGDYGDQGREKESMPAPPLIPQSRIVGSPAWIKKNHHVFHRIDLDTGWHIWAANSAGDPNNVQGFDVTLYHIDEDLRMGQWWLEASSRVQLTNGFLRWTALPHGDNDALMNMSKRADEQLKWPEEQRTTVKIQATMYDNIYMSDKSKRSLETIWKSAGEDVFNQRALGLLSLESTRMYPSFNKDIQGFKSQRSECARKLQETGGEVPAGWCRYMVVDPGHTICGVLFIAVPPPELGDHIYIYDECYIQMATATMFADAVTPKLNAAPFQAFIIDAHGGALREIGSGYTPREQYTFHLSKRGLRSIETHSEFISGCDQMEGRETALREWLRIREDGSTKLLFNPDTCPNFIREMEGFRKKSVDQNGTRIILNEGNRRSHTHLAECAEYAAAYGCAFKRPPKSVSHESWAERTIRMDKARATRYRAINGHEAGNSRILGPQGVKS
jgi:hypothetical protein